MHSWFSCFLKNGFKGSELIKTKLESTQVNQVSFIANTSKSNLSTQPNLVEQQRI